MADTIVHAPSRSRVFSKILQRLQRGSSMSTMVNKGGKGPISRIRHRIWIAATADPAVDAGSEATYPVAIGDLAYRNDTDEVFICSVAPTANTAATFIQMHA